MTRARDLADLGDSATGIESAWTSYTPTIKQGTTTLTATINRAKYKQIGKTVFLSVSATITQTGSAGTVIYVGIPSGLAPLNGSDGLTNGIFFYQDTGTAYYSGICSLSAANPTFFQGIAHNTANSIGNAPSFTAANTDIVSLTITYEVA